MCFDGQIQDSTSLSIFRLIKLAKRQTTLNSRYLLMIPVPFLVALGSGFSFSRTIQSQARWVLVWLHLKPWSEFYWLQGPQSTISLQFPKNIFGFLHNLPLSGVACALKNLEFPQESVVCCECLHLEVGLLCAPRHPPLSQRGTGIERFESDVKSQWEFLRHP